jgi:lysophospholipase L1-like esterase
MRDLPIVAVLAPLLIAQAKRVRAKVPKLPEAKGSRAGRVGSGQCLKLLVLGDSAAAGVGVSHQDVALGGQIVSQLMHEFHLDWDVVAQAGATTAKVLAWIPTIERQNYDAIVVSLGINDVTAGVTRKQWMRQQQVLVQELMTRFSTNKIIISQIPGLENFQVIPQPLRWCLGMQSARFNRIAKSTWLDHPVCEFMELPLVFDQSLMADDNFHPSENAYRIWAEAFAQCIVSGEKQREAYRSNQSDIGIC